MRGERKEKREKMVLNLFDDSFAFIYHITLTMVVSKILSWSHVNRVSR